MKSICVVAVSLLCAVSDAAITGARSNSVLAGHHEHTHHHHHHKPARHHRHRNFKRSKFTDEDVDIVPKEILVATSDEAQVAVAVAEVVSEEKLTTEERLDVEVEADAEVDTTAEVEVDIVVAKPKEPKAPVVQITDEDARSALDFAALQATFDERCSADNHQILSDDLTSVPAASPRWHGLMGIEENIQRTGAQYLATQTLMMFDRCSNIAGDRVVVNDEGFNSCCQVLHEGCCNAAQRLGAIKQTSGVSHYWPLICQRATGFPFGGTEASEANHCLAHTEERRRILSQAHDGPY